MFTRTCLLPLLLLVFQLVRPSGCLAQSEGLPVSADFYNTSEYLDSSTELDSLMRIKLKDWKKRDRLDSLLSWCHDHDHFTGLALIYDGKEMRIKQGFGQPDNSQFRIGSIASTFTSGIFKILEREGKFKLTNRVSRYLDDFPYRDVTFEHLISHQSGINNFTEEDFFLPVILRSKKTKERERETMMEIKQQARASCFFFFFSTRCRNWKSES